jgi:hypothetical protein
VLETKFKFENVLDVQKQLLELEVIEEQRKEL